MWIINLYSLTHCLGEFSKDIHDYQLQPPLAEGRSDQHNECYVYSNINELEECIQITIRTAGNCYKVDKATNEKRKEKKRKRMRKNCNIKHKESNRENKQK